MWLFHTLSLMGLMCAIELIARKHMAVSKQTINRAGEYS